MNRLSVLSDSSGIAGHLRQQMAGVFEVRFVSLDRISDLQPEQFTVVDVSLQKTDHLLGLKEWLKRKPKDAKVIFAVDKGSRIEVTRAFAVGATDVVARPINGRALLALLQDDFGVVAGSAENAEFRPSPGVSAAIDTLENIFSAACLGAPIEPGPIASAGVAIVGQLDEDGLRSWIETVRKHHSQTYQHCLLVTGLAVAFGQQLGVSYADRQRLSLAGMLHDIGKARVPVAILEKPGPLDKDELAVMRQHPQLGIDALGTSSGFAPEMIDMVIHHHESLDGSGYPHGLHGSEISDLVRVMTISDIFGALIERRSYKPPLPGEAAYGILLDMGPKLDQDLVRAFRPVAQLDQVA
jgi:putative nucleotidyltransferase with HDIG domain